MSNPIRDYSSCLQRFDPDQAGLKKTEADDEKIDRAELEIILNDPEKKTKFLSAIVSEVARLERRANEMFKDRTIEGLTAEDFIERPVLYLKAVYFDVITGKAAKWLAADFERLREKIVRDKSGAIMYRLFRE